MLLVVRPKRLRGRDAHSVAKSTGKFLTAPTAPKKFEEKHIEENDFKKMQSSFQIWGYVRHFFLRVTRALGTFCGSRTSSISNPPSSECGGIPSSPYIGVRACVCARSCAYLCAGKRKKMALTQIPPEEKFYTSMPWW